MRLVDLYPIKGTFAPGEMVRLTTEVEADSSAPVAIRLSVVHLASTVATLSRSVTLRAGIQKITLDWRAPQTAPRGYGAEVALFDAAGRVLDSASTAFDVLPHWTAFPRYGFLSDFMPGRADVDETLDALTRFHVNGLQFYDWQYRHDCLLPPHDNYVDPLGRPLSLDTVRDFIEAAHARGMAALPYLAIYAASADFWRAHPDWALYDSQRQPIAFGENFLGLMDPTTDGPWARHLLDECGRVLSALSFDGLHVDQYGDPKVAFNAAGAEVDLPAAFTSFVSAAKKAYPHAAVVFNAVGNWPIESLAVAPQDFVYIEVWPPTPTYRDLQQTVAGARKLSGWKPVVIALYLPTDRLVNIRLADALIFTCGGTRIEIGERERLLADPYFPKHQPISPDLMAALRRYYDFAVRYSDLIGPAANDDPECQVQVPPGVWAIPRACPGWLVVALINMTDLGDPHWVDALHRPTPLTNVPLEIVLADDICCVWWASPDRGELQLNPTAHSPGSQGVCVTLPYLDYWSIVAIKLNTEE